MYIRINYKKAGVQILVIWLLSELSRAFYMSLSLAILISLEWAQNASIYHSRDHCCLHSLTMWACKLLS